MLGGSAFTDMMLTDLIPMIEKTYRVLPGSANRAMAGLSMGGMQTKSTTMANLDKFSYIGLFSGGNITRRREGPGRFQETGEGRVLRQRRTGKARGEHCRGG